LSSIRTDSLTIIFVSFCLNSIKDSRKDTVLSMYLKTLAPEFSEYAMNRPQARRPFGLEWSHMRKPFVQVTNAERAQSIRKACARVIEDSQLCIPSGSLVGLDPIESLRAKRRFFLRGESPDGFNDDLDVKRISFVEDIKATSVLHEAVFSCFYPAVEYIVQNSAFPSIVRDRNGQTALDLALSMKVSDLEPWQVSSVNTIIELLLQRTKLKQPDSNLPLVWEEIPSQPARRIPGVKCEPTKSIINLRPADIQPLARNPHTAWTSPLFSWWFDLFPWPRPLHAQATR
jgi:hypothetical protein